MKINRLTFKQWLRKRKSDLSRQENVIKTASEFTLAIVGVFFAYQSVKLAGVANELTKQGNILSENAN